MLGYEFFIDSESGDSYRLDLFIGNMMWMYLNVYYEKVFVIVY